MTRSSAIKVVTVHRTLLFELTQHSLVKRITLKETDKQGRRGDSMHHYMTILCRFVRGGNGCRRKDGVTAGQRHCVGAGVPAKRHSHAAALHPALHE